MIHKRSKRIVYVQYTNPAGYPPLEHSSQILAHADWQVLFLGTRAFGADALRFPTHPGISVRQLGLPHPGWIQKMHYLFYLVWAIGWVIRWRPQWIYASDPLACPVALVLSYLPGLHLVYHEHDSPRSGLTKSAFMRGVYWARSHLARRVRACVLPNQERAMLFKKYTATTRPIITVWNCPNVEEVGIPKPKVNEEALRILYHGSIVPTRLPISVIKALAQLPATIKLRIIGYETVGHVGYVAELKECVVQFGLQERVEFLGSIPQRSELLKLCRECDVGLALMPKLSCDLNEQTMTGASNKPFDYLASGLALLVSNLPDWHQMYVEPQYGLACDPDDPASIAAALRCFLHNPQAMREMGERGRQQILQKWNYETQFSSIRRILWEGTVEHV